MAYRHTSVVALTLTCIASCTANSPTLPFKARPIPGLVPPIQITETQRIGDGLRFDILDANGIRALVWSPGNVDASNREHWWSIHVANYGREEDRHPGYGRWLAQDGEEEREVLAFLKSWLLRNGFVEANHQELMAHITERASRLTEEEAAALREAKTPFSPEEAIALRILALLERVASRNAGHYRDIE